MFFLQQVGAMYDPAIGFPGVVLGVTLPARYLIVNGGFGQ